MTKDEQLIIQVLGAYKNGKIDFSKVPELELLVQKEVNKEFSDYQESMARLANQQTEATLQELKTEAQEKLSRLDLKAEVLKEIQDEKNGLLALKNEIQEHREKINADRYHESLERFGIIIANIVCLLSFLVVGVILGQWIYKGVWDGWGLHILYDVVINMQPEHPYGAIVLGLGGFGLIALGIYGSFRLMYAATSWLDKRPNIFKKIR